MHTKALAALFSLSFVACTGVIEGGGPGGGDDTGGGGGETCGDGVVQVGEGCDDGNGVSGDGCSSACTTESSATPRVNATIDKVTVTTELGLTERLTLSLTSVDGFAGTVNLVPTVDYGTATGDWTVTLSKPSATLVAGGTDTITADVVIPSNTAALTGTVKVAVTGAPMPVDLSATVNVTNEYTVSISSDSSESIPHIYLNNSNVIRLRKGAVLKFKNDDTIAHRIHGNGAVPHEDTGGGQPGSTYRVPLTDSGNGTWYCHDHGEDGAASYNIAIAE